ncbi:hypothetical protein M7I_6750 [Glarea lozoyensis 74030]|uniref:Uncharacterized protein n=1 Tax=Glarea lozoyensis (strain ATCC 74030 / MF5533) TaxID=1104152 RepID=H0EVF2_GLAL7|nr:hypothetical protein M7I_6750 [Glarea lozoyensis 74030]
MVQRGVFFTARAVEAVSVKLGFGKFEVGDHWQCRACTHGEDDLCDDCIDSWVGELTHLNYSDDYERRLNVTAGITMMIMGLAAILGNASMNMWEEGDVVAALFIGVMSSLYSVWDICDDLILRKVNESDASVFAKRYGGSSQCWGVIWSIISLFFMVGGILAGIAAFPEDWQEQEDDSKKFIPT